MKKITTYLFALLFCLMGCTDDDALPPTEAESYSLKLYLPELMQVSLTRAVINETTVTDLYVYADEGSEPIAHFSGNEITEASYGKALITGRSIQISPATQKLTVTANASIPNNKVLTSPLINKEGYDVLPMWGSVTINRSQGNKEITVNLQCSVTKVTVDSEESSGINLSECKLYYTSNQGFLVQAEDASGAIPMGTEVSSEAISWETGAAGYCFPTAKSTADPTGNSTCKPRVVVKSRVEGADYYYPIEFCKAGNYLDLLPNHHYQITIKEITGKGYSSIEDALRFPPLNTVVDITDHRPYIYDMVANGTDELGVPHLIELEAQGSNGEAVTETAKIFTTYNPDAEQGNPYSTTPVCVIPEDAESWIRMEIDTQQPTPTTNNDTRGYDYTCRLKAQPNPSTTPREAKITIQVGLLERTFIVRQKGISLQEALKEMPIKLYRGESRTELITDDYFRSLNWRTNHEESNKPNIYGTLPKDMQGVSRVGLIFSGMLKVKDEKDNQGYTYTISKEKITNITSTSNDITITENNGEYYIYLNSLRNRTIADKTSTTITLTTNDNATIKIPVYLCGTLAYLDGSNGQIVPTGTHPKEGWFYYEFVKNGDSGYYIFDRNIGARTNNYYTDLTETGDPDAIGAYFYKNYTDWIWKDNTNYYQGVNEPHHAIADQLELPLNKTLNLSYPALAWEGKACICPCLTPTLDNPFRVYLPIVKYMEGHCWRDGWVKEIIKDENGNEISRTYYDPQHLNDGHKRGDGGYYWREDDKTQENGQPLKESQFWWNIYHFALSGYSIDTFRCTEEQGGRTELYYGMQVRPIYRPNVSSL